MLTFFLHIFAVREGTMAKLLLGTIVSFSLLLNTAIANDNGSFNQTMNVFSASPTARDTSQGPASANSNQTQEATSQPSEATPPAAKPQIDLVSILFNFDPELNVSLGIERTDEDTYLIVEMDHNPTRSGFVFRFDQVYPGLITDTVVVGNGVFGFRNKPTAQLPMIETREQLAKFILGAKKNRTHQRINLSKATRELAEIKRLMSSDGTHFTPKEIKDFQLLVKKAGGQGADILELKTERLPKNKIHQIRGTEVLTDLVELAHYSVGQEIKLKAHYKMPYRSSHTQWVIIPEKSDQMGLAYKLVNNPVVGDLYEVATVAEDMDRVLPKTKQGFSWVKVHEHDGVSTFSLARDGVRLSPKILMNYVYHLSDLIQQADLQNQDLETVLPQILQDQIPIAILEQRMSYVVSEILAASSPMHVLQILLREQNLFKTVELVSPAGQCGDYLTH